MHRGYIGASDNVGDHSMVTMWASRWTWLTQDTIFLNFLYIYIFFPHFSLCFGAPAKFYIRFQKEHFQRGRSARCLKQMVWIPPLVPTLKQMVSYPLILREPFVYTAASWKNVSRSVQDLQLFLKLWPNWKLFGGGHLCMDFLGL